MKVSWQVKKDVSHKLNHETNKNRMTPQNVIKR